MALKENKNNYSIDDYNKSIKDIGNANDLFNKDETRHFSKTLTINDIEKNNNMNSDINTKRRKSSHSSINCIDTNPNKKGSNTESNKITEENIFRDSNIVFSLKNKIKDLNNELNKLRNDSNVQNYNILEMNYKLKNKEINELKQENNFFRFNLEEKKRNLGKKLKKGKDFNNNKNKYIINSVKKYKNRNLLKPIKEQQSSITLDKEEENEKDEMIDNLKFENEKLRKIVKES